MNVIASKKDYRRYIINFKKRDAVLLLPLYKSLSSEKSPKRKPNDRPYYPNILPHPPNNFLEIRTKNKKVTT